MTVSSIIGSDKVLVDLEKAIQSDQNSVILLTGPSGRGKTWLGTNLMNHVQDAKHCYVYLTGDSSRVSETHYPLKQFIEKKDRIRTKGLGIVKQSLGELPYVGKGIHELIKDHDFKRHKKTIQDISPLKEHRDFSLHLLGLNRKYEKVIFICDDIEEFDAKTIAYLADLKSGFSQLGESFNISFVLIVNSKFNWPHQPAFGITSEIDLAPLNQSQIMELVKFWSAKEVPTEQLTLINSCSGGHLTLLKLIADHFKEAQELGTSQSV
ncbi:MAG: ATP-binding protein [Bacteroidia bacterium]|nr:ATP-binding protein [Bacteroidia bacterium]